MFSFLKDKKASPKEKPSLWQRLRQGLQRSREAFAGKLRSLLGKRYHLDEEVREKLLETLIMADVGLKTANALIEELQAYLDQSHTEKPDALTGLQQVLIEKLQAIAQPLVLNADSPFVVLMVGVNGAGKTTTAAKLAHYYKQQNKKLMLAAGDTFRAAAIEQLQIWGEREGIPVIAQQHGADSAAVIFDAYTSARAKRVDILIADTAGRLHTQDALMNELEKVLRILKKQNPDAPHETLLILDATSGQNALNQAKEFTQRLNVTGLCLVKLDGTAKGGVLFTIADQLQLPVRFVGLGEGIDDLQPFDAKAFVHALLDIEV